MQAKAINQNLESLVVTNKVATISQADANFLFNNIETSKVALLDSEEMKETKGEFLPVLLRLVGSSLFANAPGLNDSIYNGTLIQHLGSFATDEIIQAYENWIK
ncbi:hypothetical protein CQA66_04075 [Helicobacter aurati]|uniref:Uncharacterized protein n=1 Tax=Helicobacter aurati TaxID=137778 RepID=A0A3D8J4S7_9HELI|nr:hypothetical protein [Helicobacter aurati]RDU72499.1 hypothetical protein CQA66_04075 [Helicobacter aurati]